jgi:hypothetical protein
MDVNVRGIDGDLWRRLRAAAVLRQIPLGKLLNEIIREWLERHQ